MTNVEGEQRKIFDPEFKQAKKCILYLLIKSDKKIYILSSIHYVQPLQGPKNLLRKQIVA